MIVDVDELRPLLGEEMCHVWRDMAAVIGSRSYRLMGGTAIVAYLRHRQSFDLDFMAIKPFDGTKLVHKLHRKFPDAVISDADKNWASWRIRGVLVQVFLERFGEDRRQPRWVGHPVNVSGLSIGSLPDLFASKLHAVSARQQLRDCVDIVALDANSGMRLEQGVEFYRARYQASEADVRELLRRLDPTEELMPDRVLGIDPAPIMQTMRSRAFDVRSYLSRTSRNGVSTVSTAKASPLTTRQAAKPLHLQAGDAVSARCGAWMPRAKAHCVLPGRHAGPHRSK